jgi:hypothetical protein
MGTTNEMSQAWCRLDSGDAHPGSRLGCVGGLGGNLNAIDIEIEVAAVSGEHHQMPRANDLPPLPSIPLGRYRHYKGGEYEVLGVVRHSETLEPLVLYRPLYNDSGSWVRPLTMFFETIEHDGRRQPRFDLIEVKG